MIFTSLELENFRQFYGTQHVELKASEDRNVIVVYGPNGGGKTTLLNAFTWGLYGTTTPAFEQPEDLVNRRAWHESDVGHDVTARVRLEFIDEDRQFIVERKTTKRKEHDGSARTIDDGAVSVGFVDETGEYHSRDSTWKGTINEILPERLHSFFFFDGERIEQLVKPSAYEEIEKAIKTILGLDVVERAVKHCAEARRDLERELRQHGSDEDRAITDELERLRDRQDEKESSLVELRGNLDASERELERMNNGLAQKQEAAELQRQRQELERDLTEVEDHIAKSNASLANSLRRDGYLAFIPELATHVADTFEERREKRELPKDIKQQFIDDLLENGTCICGNDLGHNDDARAQVASWREKAGRRDVEDAWNNVSAEAKAVPERRQAMYAYIRETLDERRQHEQGKKRIEDKLSAIHEDLRGIDSEEVQQLEARRDETVAAIAGYHRSIGATGHELEEIKERIRDNEKELQKQQAANAAAELDRRRVRAAGEAGEVFQRILELRTYEVRTLIDARIKSLYSQISFKAYEPALDERFRLDLFDRVGGERQSVAKSQGENQILSLSFVGAVAEYARERHRENDNGAGPVTFQGGIYPIVMDSPFGSLDLNYRERIAEAIPVLAPQVIVFVSKSQGLSAVQEKLGPRISHEIIIEFQTPKPEFEPEDIELRSGTYPYIVRSPEDYEWATLKPVG